jgi:hypothetical protein
MKKLLAIVSLVLICMPLNTMFGGGDKIFWSADNMLTWKDFKKEIPKNSKTKSHGFVGIDIDPEKKDNDDYTLQVTIHAYFLKPSSERPDKDEQSDDALHHEQKRFDLAEVYARKLRKQISDSTFKTAGKFYVVASKITKQLTKECGEEGKLYDEQTKNGTIDTAQSRWDKYIDGMLQKYGGSEDVEMDVTVEKKITKDIK